MFLQVLDVVAQLVDLLLELGLVLLLELVSSDDGGRADEEDLALAEAGVGEVQDFAEREEDAGQLA